MRSARLTDDPIVLSRRPGAYTANEGSFPKLGPRLYSPSNSLGPASRPGILAKTLSGLHPPINKLRSGEEGPTGGFWVKCARLSDSPATQRPSRGGAGYRQARRACHRLGS